MIKTTLEKEHNISTINETVGGLDLVGNTNGDFYVTIQADLYDDDYSSVTLGSYTQESDDYIIAITTMIEGSADDLYLRIQKLRKSDGYMTLEKYDCPYYCSSITLAKYLNNHIYIGYYDSASFDSYVDYDINNATITGYNTLYTGSGVDMSNSAVEYNGYNINGRYISELLSSRYRIKNQLKFSKII